MTDLMLLHNFLQMKKLLGSILILIILLLAVLMINTWRSPSRQIEPDPPSVFTLPDSAFDHLSEAIRIPTVSGPAIDTPTFVIFNKFLYQKFPQTFARAEHQVVNDFSHVLSLQGSDNALSPILLCAHHDVVPVDDVGQWSVPPFEGRIDDEFIWGRGSLDDKLSTLGILESMEKLIEEGFKPKRTIVVALGHDEETGGKNGALAIAQLFKEEGRSFLFALDEGYVVLEEALEGLPAPAGLIGIAEKGYATLALQVSLEDGGHSSMPPDVTAVGKLSTAIHHIVDHPFDPSLAGVSGLLFDYLGPEMNFPNNVIFANQWLFGGMIKSSLSNSPSSNAIIRTTIAPTMISGGVAPNVLPMSASAKINFRIIPGENVSTVIAHIEKAIGDTSVQISTTQEDFKNEAPRISPVEGEGFALVSTTVKQIFPHCIVAPSLVIAATDGRHYEDICEGVYRFLPVQITKTDLKRIHGKNERISKDNYKKTIRFYYQLIKNLDK